MIDILHVYYQHNWLASFLQGHREVALGHHHVLAVYQSIFFEFNKYVNCKDQPNSNEKVAICSTKIYQQLQNHSLKAHTLLYGVVAPCI